MIKFKVTLTFFFCFITSDFIHAESSIDTRSLMNFNGVYSTEIFKYDRTIKRLSGIQVRRHFRFFNNYTVTSLVDKIDINNEKVYKKLDYTKNKSVSIGRYYIDSGSITFMINNQNGPDHYNGQLKSKSLSLYLRHPIKRDFSFVKFIPIVAIKERPTETNYEEYFNKFTSKNKIKKSEAFKKFNQQSEKNKIKILQYIYLDNHLLTSDSSWPLILMVSSFGSIRFKALEDGLHEQLNRILNAQKKYQNYIEPLMPLQLKFYLNLLAYISLDGDRAFNTLFRYIELNPIEGSRVLNIFLKIPFNPESDLVIKLLDLISYQPSIFSGYKVSIYELENIFDRYITYKNSNLIITALSNNIDELNRNTEGLDNAVILSSINERIRLLKKIKLKYITKFPYKKPFLKIAKHYYDYFPAIISNTTRKLSVPYSAGAKLPDKEFHKEYINRLHKSVFSAEYELSGIQYQTGITYVGSCNCKDDIKAVYILINNNSQSDKIVLVDFQFTNKLGYVISNRKITDDFIVKKTKNNVIGTTGINYSLDVTGLNVEITVRDIVYNEPETEILRSNISIANNFIPKSIDSDLLHNYKDILIKNRSKLIYDKETQYLCKDKYRVHLFKYTSDYSKLQILHYYAECFKLYIDGRTRGHQYQTLHKIAENGKYKKLIELTDHHSENDLTKERGRLFELIENIYDVNNDGDIELVISDNSRRTYIYKLKNEKLIELFEIYSPSEDHTDPKYISNPFLY